MRNLLFIFLLAFIKLSAQESLETPEQVNGFETMAQERIFVHFNTSLVLAGEYIYYKLYCYDGKESSPSEISKVAYVELVGNEGFQVFNHKIRLTDGQGNGDFFVPASVPSGSYKLLAYTRWMRNGTISDFFQADIVIINPYQVDQSGIQATVSASNDTVTANTNVQKIAPRKVTEADYSNGLLQLALEKKNFNKRDKVSFTLKTKKDKTGILGSYSVSVRKKDVMTTAPTQSAHEFQKINGTKEFGYERGNGQTIYLPELRGELFHGKVEAVTGDYPVSYQKIAVSIPGENLYFNVVRTSSSGDFYFSIKERYTGDSLMLQLLSEYPERYRITLKPIDQVDYSKLIFKEVYIEPSMKDEILERSIHNQIENSYFQFRPDSVKTTQRTQIFDNKEKTVYLLDDYTRFKTVRETLQEIIKDVSTQRIGKDDYVVKVKGYDYASTSKLLPLILVDGCIIQDHNAFIEFNAQIIDEITVMRHKLIIGPEVFLGVLKINTKSGNGYETLGNSISVTSIFKPQINKNYFVQDYERVTSEPRLPDDRLQLLWMPKLKLEDDTSEIEFYTSDVAGEFIIQLEGFTEENLPVSIMKTIVVE